MRKLLAPLILVATFALAMPDTVRAEPRPAAWNCALEGNLSGASIGFIFGGEFLRGRGVIRCTGRDTNRNRVYREIPVRLSTVGAGWAFDFTIIRNVHIRSAGIGVVDPAHLEGSFGVGATAGGTLVNRGIAFDAAIKLQRRGGGGFEKGL